MIVGLAAFVLDLMLWSEWGPAYVRRRRTVATTAGYPAETAYGYRRVWPRRRAVVEDEVVDPPPGPAP